MINSQNPHELIVLHSERQQFHSSLLSCFASTEVFFLRIKLLWIRNGNGGPLVVDFQKKLFWIKRWLISLPTNGNITKTNIKPCFFVQQLDLSASHKRPCSNLQVEQQLKDGDLQTQVDGWRRCMGDDGWRWVDGFPRDLSSSRSLVLVKLHK